MAEYESLSLGVKFNISIRGSYFVVKFLSTVLTVFSAYDMVLILSVFSVSTETTLLYFLIPSHTPATSCNSNTFREIIYQSKGTLAKAPQCTSLELLSSNRGAISAFISSSSFSSNENMLSLCDFLNHEMSHGSKKSKISEILKNNTIIVLCNIVPLSDLTGLQEVGNIVEDDSSHA